MIGKQKQSEFIWLGLLALAWDGKIASQIIDMK